MPMYQIKIYSRDDMNTVLYKSYLYQTFAACETEYLRRVEDTACRQVIDADGSEYDNPLYGGVVIIEKED